MAYQISWHVPSLVICLRLEGVVTLKEFGEINQSIIRHLDDNHVKAVLLIDAARATVPSILQIETIRASQTYAEHPRLQSIFIAATDKLTRLVMLLIFHLSKANVRFYNTMDEATGFLKQRGYAVAEMGDA